MNQDSDLARIMELREVIDELERDLANVTRQRDALIRAARDVTDNADILFGQGKCAVDDVDLESLRSAIRQCEGGR